MTTDQYTNTKSIISLFLSDDEFVITHTKHIIENNDIKAFKEIVKFDNLLENKFFDETNIFREELIEHAQKHNATRILIHMISLRWMDERYNISLFSSKVLEEFYSFHNAPRTIQETITLCMKTPASDFVNRSFSETEVVNYAKELIRSDSGMLYNLVDYDKFDGDQHIVKNNSSLFEFAKCCNSVRCMKILSDL